MGVLVGETDEDLAAPFVDRPNFTISRLLSGRIMVRVRHAIYVGPIRNVTTNIRRILRREGREGLEGVIFAEARSKNLADDTEPSIPVRG